MGAAMEARSLSKNWVVDHDAIHLEKIHSLGAAIRCNKMLILQEESRRVMSP